MNDLGPVEARTTDVAMDVVAQRLSFGPGLYLVTMTGGGRHQAGSLSLPCVRLDSLPPSPDTPGRSYVSCLAEGQWLTGGSQSAFLRVEGGQAALILTTYNPVGGAQPPQVRIRLVRDAGAAAGLISLAAVPAPVTDRAPPTPAAPLAEASRPETAISLTVHCAGLGDIAGGLDTWVGTDDPAAAIEAFAIGLGAPNDRLSLEYQAIMGVEWVSPWVQAPELCGSRGLSLPIFGLRVNMRGTDAARYELLLWGRSGQREIGPIATGELQSGVGQPLTALKITLRPARPERRSRKRVVARWEQQSTDP